MQQSSLLRGRPEIHSSPAMGMIAAHDAGDPAVVHEHKEGDDQGQEGLGKDPAQAEVGKVFFLGGEAVADRQLLQLFVVVHAADAAAVGADGLIVLKRGLPVSEEAVVDAVAPGNQAQDRDNKAQEEDLWPRSIRQSDRESRRGGKGGRPSW